MQCGLNWGTSTTALVTFAEFEQLPDLDAGKRELIDGEVITMPPPERNAIVARLLPRPGESRVMGDHTGYRIGDGWLEPDVSILRPGQPCDDKYFLGSPMVAVEIISPGEDTNRKITLYLENGAVEVWIIDPRKRTMSVYFKCGGDVIWLAVQKEYRSEALDIALRVSQIFG